MKKTVFLSIIMFAFTSLKAQMIENNPCTAYCLDPSGKIAGQQPIQDGISPNLNIPCGDGTTEDNPIWWVFRPSKNKITFTITTSGCIAGKCGLGVQLSTFGGINCNSLNSLNCVVGTSGTFTTDVVAGRTYYLQLDGLCECQCNFTLTYPKGELLQDVPAPEIKAPSKACVGSQVEVCAIFPNFANFSPDRLNWTVDSTVSAKITLIPGKPLCANLKINEMPTSGKAKICAKPFFNGKCLPNIQESCVEIDVVNSSLVAIATANSPVCEGKTAMLEALGGTSYKWSGPDNFSSTLANPTIPNVQAKNAGLYSVEVTNADNCKGNATTNLVVENCISSKDIPSRSVQIYPNPFTQQINIDTDDIIKSMTIYNILGQVVFEQQYQDVNIMLDLSELNVGYYALNINWANGDSSKYKLMKQ